MIIFECLEYCILVMCILIYNCFVDDVYMLIKVNVLGGMVFMYVYILLMFF